MTCILEIGDRRRLKAGIRVGHRAPCSGGRLNFAEAWRATSARPSPSEEDTPSSKNGKAKETVHPCCKYRRKAKRVETPALTAKTPVIGRQAAPAIPTEAGQAAPARAGWTASPNSWARSSGCGPRGGRACAAGRGRSSRTQSRKSVSTTEFRIQAAREALKDLHTRPTTTFCICPGPELDWDVRLSEPEAARMYNATTEELKQFDF